MREAGDQQMNMLKSELRKAEDSLATLTRETVDTGTVDKIRKMKNQNENLGAENFEYAVENVSSGESERVCVLSGLFCY